MVWVDLIAVLALLQYMIFIFAVSAARKKYDIQAPAMSGNETFERLYRVQMNTLEQLIIFLPTLYLANTYWPISWVVTLGVIYLVGRVLYFREYLHNPASRTLGFALSILPILVLLILSVIGLVIEAVKVS